MGNRDTEIRMGSRKAKGRDGWGLRTREYESNERVECRVRLR